MPDTPILGNGNGHGAPAKALTLTLTYDPATFQVLIGGDALPLNLAQMMLDEAGRQLEQQRRLAAALDARRQAAEQLQTQAILSNLRPGRA
jgi:hypothetical protein